MIEKKYRDLIDKLIQKSLMKKVSWNKSSRETEYYVHFKKGSFTVDNWVNDSSVYVDFTLRNANGIEIVSQTFEKESNPEEFNYLFKLYKAAEESYIKVDETISSIINELDEEDTVGKDEEDVLPF